MNKILSFLTVALLSTLPALADRIDDMISPAFHPVTFEDPRALSEARFLYVYHAIDDKFVTQGGDVQVYALQLRYALDERFALIATKDGFVDLNPNSTLSSQTGFADIALGGKYAFYMDRESGQVATAILRYTIPTGDDDVLQGSGNGELHPSVSYAFALSDTITLTGDTGLRLAMDSDHSSFWDVDVQADYRIDTSIGKFHPLVGFGMVHVIDAGTRLPIADEGQDFFNLGASGSGGETIATGILGLRFRPSETLDLGASFQVPLDSGTGTRILEHRWMFDAIVRF